MITSFSFVYYYYCESNFLKVIVLHVTCIFTFMFQHLPSESAECRSGVTHYMIYYASTGSTLLNSLMVPNDTSSYTIRWLDTYLDYTIQITASNKDEESDRSSETIGKTLEEGETSSASNL